MSMTHVLDQLGGRDGLADAVGALYQRILEDPELAPYFEDVLLPRLRAHMVDFLTAALIDDPSVYTGRQMTDAHAGLGITATAFDHVAAHLAAILDDAGVAPADAGAVLARVARLRPAVVEEAAAG